MICSVPLLAGQSQICAECYCALHHQKFGPPHGIEEELALRSRSSDAFRGRKMDIELSLS
jgi:hypothetical protein